MRKLILAAALALPLAACQTGQAPNISPIVNTGVDLLPDRIRDNAVKVCGFLPAAETVIQLIAVFGGPAIPGIASQIAAEICAAVTTPKTATRRTAASPALHGVLIRGQFVR